MKVYYPGPGPKTYHPQLGKLIKDKPFDLPGDQAKQYVDGGLLKEFSEPTTKTADKPARTTAGKAPKGDSTKEIEDDNQ